MAPDTDPDLAGTAKRPSSCPLVVPLPCAVRKPHPAECRRYAASHSYSRSSPVPFGYLRRIRVINQMVCAEAATEHQVLQAEPAQMAAARCERLPGHTPP